MTLWLSISSILSNIFNVFINLYPMLIAFFQKTLTIAVATLVPSSLTMCCKDGGVWSEVQLFDDLIGHSNPPIRLTSSSMAEQSECYFVMAKTASKISSVFHPCHRPVPLILMITALQVGKPLQHLFIYSHTK